MGDAALAAGAWAEAAATFEASLGLDAALGVWTREALLKLAKARWRGGDLPAARHAAQRLLSVDEGAAEAHAVLAEVALLQEAWEEAAREAARAVELDRGNGAFRDVQQRADAALKQSKTKDYYRILGLRRDADAADIKKAYRKLALEWHPDRHPEEDKKAEASKKFQDIGEANEVLTDPEKKAKYDRGEDVFGQNPNNGQHGGGHPFGGGFPCGRARARWAAPRALAASRSQRNPPPPHSFTPFSSLSPATASPRVASTFVRARARGADRYFSAFTPLRPLPRSPAAGPRAGGCPSCPSPCPSRRARARRARARA